MVGVVSPTGRPDPADESPAEVDEPFRMGELGRHSLIYGIGMVLSKAVAIVMMPIYTRLLTPSDYGVLALIQMTFEVVTIFAGSRIAYGIFHYYHKAGTGLDRRAVVSTAYVLLASTYCLAAVATSFAAEPLALLVFGEGDLYPTLIRLAAASMAFEGMILVPTAYLQLKDRSGVYVGVSLVRLALQVTLNLIFLIPLKMGVAGVLWSSVVTHALVGIALSVNLLYTIGSRFRLSDALDFLRFGVPLVVMQVATFVATFGDRYFLNQAASTAEVGLYSLAYQFGFLVTTLGYTPFGRVWDPQRFAVAKRPDRDVIFAQVFVYLNVILFSVALGITLFAGDALRVMATPDFYPAAAFVPVLALAYVFQSWSFFLNLGIFVTERTEYFTIANWIAALVAVVGYVWLIPHLLAWGATLTTLTSVIVLCVLAHIFSQRLWRVQYRWKPIRRMGALALVIGASSAMLPAMPLLLSVAVHTALFAGYLALLWTLPILGAVERDVIRRRVSRVLTALPGRS